MVFNAFPEEELPPLRLSSHGHEDLDCDCFDDFTLDDSDSQDSDDLESMLADSKTSADLDCMFLRDSNRMMDSTPLEYDGMRVDSIQVQENEVQSSYKSNNNVRSSRRRKSQPTLSMHRIQVNDVNFDPVPYNHQKYQRRSSCNDTNMSMETSSYTTDASNYSHPNSRPQRQVTLDSGVTYSPSQLDGYSSGVHQGGAYHEALQKLAESMKRTERSRRQLMMQRAPIGSPTSPRHHQLQHVFASPQQQWQQRFAGASVGSMSPLTVESTSEHSSSDRSSITAAFFSGSRGTLTNGLERSRSQLKVYMDQVIRYGSGHNHKHNQTL